MSMLKADVNLTEYGLSSEVSIEVPSEGCSVLFGPSGSGKTSLLRAIAGLDRHPDSKVTFDSTVWQDHNRFLPTNHRDIAYVFQEPSLFPHLNVNQNIQYAQKRVRLPKPNVISVDELVSILNIEHLLSRPSHALSVGEKQRVAIARAMATQPKLLLMDEPLSALDQGHKAEILPLLERLCRDCHTPILYVTHSQNEVDRLADHLTLIQDGRNVASGETASLLTRLDLPLAYTDDAGVVVNGSVSQYEERFGLMTVASSVGDLVLAGRDELALGSQVKLKLNARDVSISLSNVEKTSILNRLPAAVVEITDLDHAHSLIKLNCSEGILLAKLTKKSCSHLQIKPGMSVIAQIKSVALV